VKEDLFAQRSFYAATGAARRCAFPMEPERILKTFWRKRRPMAIGGPIATFTAAFSAYRAALPALLLQVVQTLSPGCPRKVVVGTYGSALSSLRSVVTPGTDLGN
jgi:hypothetical protein